MADVSVSDKELVIATVESSPLLAPGLGNPENLRRKVIHGVAMQRRRIKIDEVE
jgi:hypothetical protein